MESSKSRMTRIAMTLLFLGGMLFANFFAVRMMLRAGVDTYFYDKLLVAYTVGDERGLKLELDKITVTDKLSREAVLAKDFNERLPALTDPEGYLKLKVQQSKERLFFIRNLRSGIIVLMLILFGWQLFVKFCAKVKPHKIP